MSIDDLETRCKKSLLKIADDVRDINQKLTYFLETYRDDYYMLLEDKKYKDLY